ncbi:hypothetical protein B0J13DRAFT_114278 [Dactylonectria estremocensis]|uniref:Uncharacterized protein n=1 Tax=Dactylonectria estremocensis TaxID=1079267 RepID=A0A9P9FE46_9HYPO|nr:hypothetical protein B0J13DRAFT_114278 [Dactylonectria estremocensis]
MKGAILSAIVAAGTAAAQVTIAPELLQFNAVDTDSPEYSICETAAGIADSCISAAGNDEDAFVSCACCADSTNIAEIYAGCSSWVSVEAGATASDLYSAFGQVATLCDLGDCGSGGILTSSVSEPAFTSEAFGSEATSDVVSETTSAEDTAFTTTVTSASETSSAEDSSITSASDAEQTYAIACVDMISLFTSCTNKISGFTDLPNSDQASCYCCRTDGATLTWTDELDSYATTCADWASTGEPDTAYPVARTFATYCERFTDVCDGAAVTSTTDSESASVTRNSDSNTSVDFNGVDPVTVTVQPTETDSSDDDNAASSVRIGCGAVLAAIAALAIVL